MSSNVRTQIKKPASLALMGTYIVGVRLIQSSNLTSATASPEIEEAKTPSLWRAGIGFGLATAVLVLVAPFLVSSSAEIAAVTGLGTGFVGMVLLGVVTSLPELTTTLAAVRLGAYDLAVGNLFGSNMFNIFALGLTDVFYLEGRFLGAIDPDFALAALVGLVLTGLGLIGNLARLERRIWIIEADALLLMLAYLGGLWLLYARGIGV